MARAVDLSRALSRGAVRRVRAAARADGADRSGLSALISVHALHAAGDALVAVALAGTLFFNVPLGEARSGVALYLLLTMLPFALLVPVAGPVLDRFPHGRRTVLAVTTGGRGLLTWVMAGATAGLGLYPLALAVLVLSRAYGVARCAAVPRVRPPAVGLVSANARLNVAAVTAGAGAAAVGSGLVALTGSSGWVLRLASLLLLTGAVLALRLPEHVDEPAGPTVRSALRFRLSRTSPRVTGPLAAALTLRAVAGLLTVFLAFLFRAEGAAGILVGTVIAAAAVGQLAGTAGAARLPERASRLLAVVALALPFATCLAAALMPVGAWMVAAAGATGISVSLSKFALDAAVQAHVPPRSISKAFARSETGLQLAWVTGAAVALALPTSAVVGFGTAAALPLLGLLLARQLALRSRPPAA
ncbi:MAG: MFS transporter [Mycobacteriales bacterium]